MGFWLIPGVAGSAWFVTRDMFCTGNTDIFPSNRGKPQTPWHQLVVAQVRPGQVRGQGPAPLCPRRGGGSWCHSYCPGARRPLREVANLTGALTSAGPALPGPGVPSGPGCDRCA